MKDEAKVRRVVAALFKPLELPMERTELIEAVRSLLDISMCVIIPPDLGDRDELYRRRAEEAEVALAVREAELARVREDLRLFQNSIDLRTPEDHFKIKKYDEAMRQLATFETRVGVAVAARLQTPIEEKDREWAKYLEGTHRELAALRRTRVQVEELASQLSQLLIRG